MNRHQLREDFTCGLIVVGLIGLLFLLMLGMDALIESARR
jgi:hypothetical protein